MIYIRSESVFNRIYNVDTNIRNLYTSYNGVFDTFAVNKNDVDYSLSIK